MSIRIASYNLLAPELCNKQKYSTYDENDINQENRYRLLEKKLSNEIQKYDIFSLQEVSIAWSGRLTLFFQSRDFLLITTNYGNENNGYMGSALAINIMAYHIIDITTVCVANQYKYPSDIMPDCISRLYKYTVGYYNSLWGVETKNRQLYWAS